GDTWSTSFPISPGAFDSSWDNGWVDAFFAKLDSTGSSLLYSTYIGGHGNHDKGKGIAVDTAGNAYITGETWSNGYPIKPGSYDTDYNDEGDAFIIILNPAGAGSSDLIYSTFVGGNDNDYGYDITLDSGGDVYITGFTESTDFPYTPGAYDTIQNGGIDVFVFRLNPAGSGSSDLVYSTFIGGSVSQWGAGIVLDPGGNAYVSGPTISTDFPITPGSYDDIHNGNWDGFVVKLDPTGSTLLYSTFFGGTNEDSVTGIAIDDNGNVFTTGYTISIDFPLTMDAFDPTYNANKDIFALKLNLTKFYVRNLGVSEPYVYRNNSVMVYANGNHTYDIEPDLQPHFEYSAPGEDVWDTDYLSNLQYNNSRWEISFKPQINATLGLYDFRVRLSDTKMAFTKWTYFNDSLTVKNNFPKIENLSLSQNLALLGDSISIWINCSDVEEPEMNLTIELEYIVTDEQAWNTTYLDELKYLQNRWESNLMIHFNAPFGNYNFRARLNDSDGNYSSWLYHNDSLLIYNTPPRVIDIKLSESAINRTGSMFIYVNSTDHETDEAMLEPFLQYKHENNNDWSDFNMKYSDASTRWKFGFITDEDSIIGRYDFRVRFEDTEELTCDWVYLNDSFRVLNNIPSVVDIKISKSEVLRNNSITIYVNGSDIEDPENLLICEVQYKLPSEAWVEFDDLIYQDEHWQVEFTPPFEAELGKYDLEVKFIDLDDDYSGWTTIEEAFEVKNNFPRITEDLDDIEIGFYAESFDLTMYGLDLEDEVEVLSWSIDQSTIDTRLFQAILLIAPGNILHIVPWDNVTGEDDITLSLIDKDGGVVTKSDITLQVNSILTLVTPKVTLLSPLDNSVVNTLTPTLDWTLNYNGTKLITYSILIDENPDPQTELKAGITTTSFTLENDLENHKTYYWKVIPKGGICLSDPFSFTVDLGFFPYYEVILTLERNDLTLKPGDSATINLTVKNIGNVNDIYIVKLNVDNLIEYIEFSSIKYIALQPTYSETQQLLISLAKDTPKSEVNITIIATSFYGGEAVNDSKVIQIDIEPEVYSGVDSGRKLETVILFIWAIIILIIIIIGIIIAAILKKRKQKAQAELAAQEMARVGVEIGQLPGVSSVQGSGSAPQLSAAGHPGSPTPILGTSASMTA
ncbi:MAG: SBBP repeat-containing protein, partial [Thermoplasmata archaeon]|nr:SBBP repeat-containing protein [Thermoplasmata archaeon]